MKKILLFLSFLLMSIGAWGGETTYTFTSKSWAASPANWTSSKDGNQMQSGRGIQVTTGSSGANGTSPISFTNVSQVVVTYSTNASAGAGSIAVQIGSNTASSQSVTKTGGTTDRTLTYNFSPNQTGSVKVTVTCTTNSIYVKSITITESGSSPTTYTVTYALNGGEGTTPTESRKGAGATFTLHNGTTDITPPSGKQFYKWKDQDNVEFAGGTTYTMPSKNVTLTAQWQDVVVPPTPVDCDGDFYDFSLIDDFSDWGTGYGEKILIYTDDSIILSSANRQTQTITDIPVTKGSDVIVKGRNNKKISSVNLVCRQWANKEQTIELWYSTDGGGTFNTTGVVSNNFTLYYNELNPNTNAIKFTFSSSSNQIGIENLCINHDICIPTISVTKIEQGGTFDLSSDSVCENGSVTLSNIIPSEGYKFDTIICLAQDGEDFLEHGTVNVSNSTISGITKDCYIVVIFSQLPPEPEIDVVEWNPDYIKIDIDNFDAVTAVIENKNTQLNVENTATELFFSKYFEAQGAVKLLGIYNGTKEEKILSDYVIRAASGKRSGQWKKLYELGELPNIQPSEEIILISYTDKDNSIIACINEKSGVSQYIKVEDNGDVDGNLDFNGDDAIGLFKVNASDTTLIDIIGAGTTAAPNITGLSSDSLVVINGKTYSDQYCWYTTTGDSIGGDTHDYYLSTNLCLLIRKPTVHSGDTAVKYNTNSFVTLSSEWVGKQVKRRQEDQDGISTCNNFDYVGTFDYGNYYAQYTQVGDEILLGQTEPDGSYKINIQDLDTLSCTLLKVIVSDNSNKSEECEYKIPIFVTEDTNSNSLLFSQEGDDCPECDVVIINGGKLTVNSTLVNRDVTVYPGGVLVIPGGQTYSINSLTLRRENNEVPYFSYKGNLVLTDKFYVDLRTDADDWRWMTLPFSHKVSDIAYPNGKKPVLNSEIFLEYYDGDYRAQYKSNAWKFHNYDDVFNAGQGFLFGVDLPGHTKKTYRFSFIPDSVEHEKSDKIVKNLFAWGGNNTELAPNHKGWNLIGNPFMDNDTTDIITPIRIGSLKKDSVNGQWTGGWAVDSVTTKLRYAVIPNKDEQFADAGYYESVVLDDYILKPLTSFFVQLGGNEEDMQTLTFKPEKRINRIVARNYQMQGDDETFLRIKVDDWKTGCFISNKFTEDYEPGDDLESRYKIYQSIGGYKLLYSAINDSIIESGIKVTSPNGNLHLDEKTNIDVFEYIYVLYDDNWYDLLHGETVGIENSNFILQAKRKNNGITTDINHIPTRGLYKYTDGVNIYINKNGAIFDIVGSKVK